MSDLDPRLAALAGDDEWTRHRTLEELRSEGLPGPRIHDLHRCLAHDDATLRASARMALAALAAPDSKSRSAAQAELRAALSSDIEDVRILAASALGEAGDSDAGPALVEALADPSLNVVAAAADALGELRYAPALEPLAELSGTGELWLRAAAIVALGRLQDERAIKILDRLAGEPGLERPIAEAAARIHHPSTLQVLERTRQGAPHVSLRAAGSVLAAFPDVEAPTWVVTAARERAESLRDALIRKDDPAVARLVGLTGSAGSVRFLVELIGPPRWSEAAIAGLLAVPPEPRAEAILERLDDADGREMVSLLSLLPPLTERSWIHKIVPLLRHRGEAVRGAAAEALARSPAADSLPALAEELRRERVAPEVIRAMGGLGQGACVSLVPLLRDPSAPVRLAAASALMRCASAEIEEALRSALAAEEDPEVRSALLGALARSAGAAALDILVEALGSDHVDTRLAAIDGLGATGSEQVVEPLARALERSRTETLAAIRALGELAAPRAAPFLRPYLDAPDLDVRRAAAHAVLSLSDVLDHAAVDSMVEDQDGWIRMCGARILARRRGEATEGEAAEAAAEAARRRLESMAESDPDPAVRSAARQGLGDSV